MTIRFTSVAVTDGWYQNVGNFVTHIVGVDRSGRVWERWDGLGQSNGWALIRSPEEPAKRETARAKRKAPNRLERRKHES